jgi:hypothetical protein
MYPASVDKAPTVKRPAHKRVNRAVKSSSFVHTEKKVADL